MTENENENSYWYVFMVTALLYCIGALVCCVIYCTIITEDVSVGAMKMLFSLALGFFLAPIVPNVIYVVVVFVTAIKNKIKHYVDVFHYYEELKSNEDKKHLLYNNKSKTKP